MKNILRALLLGISLILSACISITPSSLTPYNQSISWKQRQSKLQSINHWHIQGAVSIRTKQDAISAHLNWQQYPKRYTLNLFGPFSLGSVIMSGHNNHFSLQTSNENFFTAKNPEALIQSQLGWHIPVSNLYFWIRGLPAPEQYQAVFDQYHHLKTLHQDGWNIQYLSYIGINGIDVPSLLKLTGHQLTLKIAISSWN